MNNKAMMSKLIKGDNPTFRKESYKMKFYSKNTKKNYFDKNS